MSEQNGVQDVNIKILNGDVSIVKTGFPNPVMLGLELNYDIVVTNNIPTPGEIINVVVEDVINSNLSFVRAGVIGKTITTTYVNGLLSCDIGAINSSETVTINVVVIPKTAGTITNQATAKVTALSGNMDYPSNTVTTTVVDVVTEVGNIKTTVDNTSTKVDGITTTVNGISTAVNSTATEVGNVKTTVDNTSTKVDGITTTVNGISTAVNSTATEVGNVKTTVDSTSTKVDGITTTVNGISTTVNSTATEVGNIKTTVDNTSTKVDGITTTVNGISTAVNSTATEVGNVKTTVEGTKTKVDDLTILATETNNRVILIQQQIGSIVNPSIYTLTTGIVVKDYSAKSVVVAVENSTFLPVSMVIILIDHTKVPFQVTNKTINVDAKNRKSFVLGEPALEYEILFNGMSEGLYAWTSTRINNVFDPLSLSQFIPCNTFRHSELVAINSII